MLTRQPAKIQRREDRASTEPSALQMIPGWPYSFVAALETRRSSWCALLDAVRLGPDDDATVLAGAQLRAVVTGLIAAGQYRPGDPEIWIVGDSGYDGARMAYLLADLPVRLLVRLRSDRVLCFPPPPAPPRITGRPARHGPEFRLADPASWPDPEHACSTETSRYRTATARSRTRLHPRLTHRGDRSRHRACRSVAPPPPPRRQPMRGPAGRPGDGDERRRVASPPR